MTNFPKEECTPNGPENREQACRRKSSLHRVHQACRSSGRATFRDTASKSVPIGTIGRRGTYIGDANELIAGLENHGNGDGHRLVGSRVGLAVTEISTLTIAASHCFTSQCEDRTH